MSFEFDATRVLPQTEVAVEVKPQTDASKTPSVASMEFRKLFGVSSAADALLTRGLALRQEAQEFTAWANRMGETTEGSATWGSTQQTYAARWRAKFHVLAAQLKADAEKVGFNLDDVFRTPAKYPFNNAVTAAARRELGI